jgi:LysR family transcriptional regulator, transcriptional activator of the cysJI operon
MTFRHLKIFLAVCELGNMTLAARQLYMSQPSISQAIAELEQHYNVRLFERFPHHPLLTAAGERLRIFASHILNLANQAQKELLNLDEKGPIRIGASLTVGAYLLPNLVTQFHQTMPDAEIFTVVDNTRLIEQHVLNDQVDIGIVEGPIHSSQIIEKAICDDELIVISASCHPLASRSLIGISDLTGQAFIMREEGSGTREIFETAMQSAGVTWKTVGVYNNNAAVQNAVAANLGLAVISRMAVQNELANHVLVALNIQGVSLHRKFNLIHHRHKFFTPVLQAFIRLLQ